MSVKYLKHIINWIKRLDVEVNDYKKISQTPSLPSIAYVNWALKLIDEGKIPEAEEKLVSSTLMAHRTPEAYINLGILKVREGKFDEAGELYIKALRLDRNSAKAHCFLGNVLTEKGKYKEAEKKFNYALKLEPNNADIYLNWGISLIRQRKFILAKEKFELASKFNKSNLTSLYFLALTDTELGDTEKAKEKFEILVEAMPDHYEAFYYLAYIYYKDKNYDESLLYALKSLAINSKKIETYMLISENYMNLNKEEDCLKHYELGENSTMINYYFLVSWGISLQHFERYEESKEKFQRAIEMQPDNELALGYLGLSFYKTNDYDAALHYLNKTLEINPQNIFALDTFGQIHYDRENYKEAVKYFEAVLKNSAKAVKTYGKIADSYFLDGNIQKANEFYGKALEYQPNEIKNYVNYAKILIEQRNYDLALKKLHSAYKLDERDFDCLNLMFYTNYMLAKENFSEYNVERAMEIVRKLEKDYPDSFSFKDEKNELETRLNNKK